MTYEEVLKIVSEEFELINDSIHNKIVRTGLTYDGCRGFCVSIYNKGDSVVITDLGETKEVFDEVEKEEWIKLCTEHGYMWNHWRIEKEFTCIEDLYDYIKFIDFISDKYFEID